jgi:AmiR/NasT family two-component response regulator
MKDVTTLRENSEDIAAAAKDINEERQRLEDQRIIEDAKAVLAQAGEANA